MSAKRTLHDKDEEHGIEESEKGPVVAKKSFTSIAFFSASHFQVNAVAWSIKNFGFAYNLKNKIKMVIRVMPSGFDRFSFLMKKMCKKN